MDLSSLPLRELNRLKARVEAEIARRSDTTRRDLLKKMQKMATEAGMSLDELMGSTPARPVAKPAARPGRKPGKVSGKTAQGKVRKVAPQYRHPDNTELEWTGRGRKPLWVNDWLEANGSLDGLRIAD